MTRRPLFRSIPIILLAACGRSAPGGDAACGLAAVAGPTALLNEFGVPRQTLGDPPDRLPERMIVRMVAGPAYAAVVGRADAGRADSGWVIGMEGTLPANAKPGYGVLILDPSDSARGVMLYEGMPVEGAPHIGTVSAGATTVPLLGIQVNPAKFEDPRCPFFPDSVLHR